MSARTDLAATAKLFLPLQEESGSTPANLGTDSITSASGIDFATDSAPGPGGEAYRSLAFWDDTARNILIPSQATLALGAESSLSAWVYLHSGDLDQSSVIIETGGTTHGINLSLQNGTVWIVTKRNEGRRAAGYDLPTWGWYHIAGRTNADGSVQLFINGTLESTDRIGTTEAWSANGSDTGAIGCADDTSLADNTRVGATELGAPFRGRLADVGVFDFALSDAQITTLSDVSSAGYTYNPNRSYWLFDNLHAGGFAHDVTQGFAVHIENFIRPILENSVRPPDGIYVHAPIPTYGESLVGYSFDNFLRAEEGQVFSGSTREIIPQTLSAWNAVRRGDYTNGRVVPLILYVGMIQDPVLETYLASNGTAAYLDRLEQCWAIFKRADFDCIAVDASVAVDDTFKPGHPGYDWLAAKARDPQEPHVQLEALPDYRQRLGFSGASYASLAGTYFFQHNDLVTTGKKQSPYDRHRGIVLDMMADAGRDERTPARMAEIEFLGDDMAFYLLRWGAIEGELPAQVASPSSHLDEIPEWPQKGGTPLRYFGDIEAIAARPAAEFWLKSVGQTPNTDNSVANGKTASFSGTPAYLGTPLTATGGAAFDTSSSNYIEFSHGLTDYPFTISFAFRHVADQTGFLATVEDASATPRVRLNVHTDNAIRVSVAPDAVGFSTLYESAADKLVDGTLYRVVWVVERGATRLYLNGELIGHDSEGVLGSVRVLPDTLPELTETPLVRVGGYGPVQDVMMLSESLEDHQALAFSRLASASIDSDEAVSRRLVQPRPAGSRGLTDTPPAFPNTTGVL